MHNKNPFDISVIIERVSNESPEASLYNLSFIYDLYKTLVFNALINFFALILFFKFLFFSSLIS